MTSNLQPIVPAKSIESHVIRSYGAKEIEGQLPTWESWYSQRGVASMSRDPRWLRVLRDGLRHEPYCLEASTEHGIVGLLPLAFVKSLLFGRFLVGLPYLNSGGIIADNSLIAGALLDAAVKLANQLKVKHLELRHEAPVEHAALTGALTNKVHMRLGLPSQADALWNSFKASVRNQIRKGEKQEFRVEWGGRDLLPSFYDVFSRNMRDLGTPVFSKRLFLNILQEFNDQAELCVLYAAQQPIAAALLCHGRGATEVPSASSLREFNSTNANMLMYWNLLQRAIERGQNTFDFGRSTIDGNTFRFKKQWGAQPFPAMWQYYVRKGDATAMRPENQKFQLAIRVWQRLPVSLTRLVGPSIVRGIP